VAKTATRIHLTVHAKSFIINIGMVLGDYVIRSTYSADRFRLYAWRPVSFQVASVSAY
jgi:hypothetical protein